MYQIIADCSSARTPRSFVVTFLNEVKSVCPYNQSITFFLNANKRIVGQYLVNVSEKTAKEYLEYYMHLCDPQLSINCDDVKEVPGKFDTMLVDWDSLEKTEYINDYIKERGLTQSLGFSFFDMNGNPRVVIALDRDTNNHFTKEERDALDILLPVLNNIHRNFFYQGEDSDEAQSPFAKFDLTPRESEIASLLCEGMSPRNISSVLSIAATTTYKHISHIYEKIGVSSQQEMLVKIINRKNIY